MASQAMAGTIWFWTESAAAAVVITKIEPRRLIRRVTRKSSRSPS